MQLILQYDLWIKKLNRSRIIDCHIKLSNHFYFITYLPGRATIYDTCPDRKECTIKEESKNKCHIGFAKRRNQLKKYA